MQTFETKNDLLLAQVRRGLAFYDECCECLTDGADYDLVFAHETYCSGLAGLYLAESFPNAVTMLDVVEYPIFDQRSSAVVREHGRLNSVSNRLTADFAADMCEKFDHVFASSEGQRATMSRLGCKKDIVVLRNCRSALTVEPSDWFVREYGFSIDDKVILFSNRAYKHTGLELALAGIAELGSDYKLVVLGEVVHEIKEGVDRLVSELGLHKQFFVTGMLDPSAVLGLVASAHIVLCLLEPENDNHKTSLPNRIFDAIVAGAPLLGMAGTESGDFIQQHHLGLLVKGGGPGEFAQAIRELIRQMGRFKKAVTAKKERFCWEKEEVAFMDVLMASGVPRSCLFLANKDIRRNDRVKRLLETLRRLHVEVDVITHYRPLPSMIVEGVNYQPTREGPVGGSQGGKSGQQSKKLVE